MGKTWEFQKEEDIFSNMLVNPEYIRHISETEKVHGPLNIIEQIIGT